ncbi:MAG: SLBB domain-containing protein [Ignavibacteriae bacterium]|nr:SLBB domain-containing protein [Ignavibacteriota bacterium]
MVKRYIRDLLILVVLTTVFPVFANAQDSNDVKIGINELSKTGANYYNYADLDKVNIEVNLWGYVKSPGKYLIPQGTTAIDLITLGGGPTVDAMLNDIRIVRLKNDTLNISKDQIINIDYNDFLWEDKIKSGMKKNPVLMPGDIILIPGEPRYFFRENLGIILSVGSFLLTAAVLVINIVNK